MSPLISAFCLNCLPICCFGFPLDAVPLSLCVRRLAVVELASSSPSSASAIMKSCELDSCCCRGRLAGFSRGSSSLASSASADSCCSIFVLVLECRRRPGPPPLCTHGYRPTVACCFGLTSILKRKEQVRQIVVIVIIP